MRESNFIREIGLDVWGCKGGYKPCLFSNGVVNVEDEDIAQTVLDIRKYVRFLRPNVDFYALEFTPKYKVFTKYRSSNDSGDGAFIAITLYVPHEQLFNGIRKVLDEMIDTYWKEYMDLDGRHLQGKYYDIAIMQAIIDAHADDIIPETGKFRRGKSKRTETPQLLLYDKVEDVDFYFSTPYRELFRRSQEITFVNKESLDPVHADDYRPVVADYLHKIENHEIGEQEPESLLLPFSVVGVSLVRLLIDGTDLTTQVRGEEGCPLTEGQTIDIELSKGPNYDNFHCTKTTEEAVSDGIIVPSGSNYKVSDKIPFQPKKKNITFRNNNPSCDADKLKPLLVLKCSDKKTYSLRYDDGKFFIVFQGETIYKPQKLYLKIHRGTDICEELVTFIPEETTEVTFDASEVEIKIDRDSIVKAPKIVTVEVSFNGKSSPLSLPFSDKPYKFYLPQQLATIAQYKIDIPGCNYKFDRNSQTLKIEPKEAEVEIDTSRLVEYNGILSSLSLNVFVDGEKHEATYSNKVHELLVTLPYRWREMKIEKIEQQNGLEVDYEVTKRGIKLKGKVVINECESMKRVSLRRIDSEIDDTTDIPLRAGKCMFVPKAYEVEKEPGSDYIMSQKDKDGNLVYYTLRQGSIVKDKEEVPDTNTDAVSILPEETEAKPVTVHMYFCDSLYFKNKGKLVRIGQSKLKSSVDSEGREYKEIRVPSEFFRICARNENELCVIIFPKEQYEENERIRFDNEKNGFRVEWEGDCCCVYYEPGFGLFVHNTARFFRRNMRKILPISFILLALIGGGCFWFLSNDKQIKIEFVGDVQKILVADLSDSYYKIDGNTLVIRDSLVIKNDVKVQLYFNKDADRADSTYTVSKERLMALWGKNKSDIIKIQKPDNPIEKNSSKIEEVKQPYTEEDRENDNRLIADAKDLLKDVDSRKKWYWENKGVGTKVQYEKIVKEIKENDERKKLEEIGKVFDDFYLNTFKKNNSEDLALASLEFKEKGYEYLSEENKEKFDATYGKADKIEFLRGQYQSVDLNNSPEASKVENSDEKKGGGIMKQNVPKYKEIKGKKKK